MVSLVSRLNFYVVNVANRGTQPKKKRSRNLIFLLFCCCRLFFCLFFVSQMGLRPFKVGVTTVSSGVKGLF